MIKLTYKARLLSEVTWPSKFEQDPNGLPAFLTGDFRAMGLEPGMILHWKRYISGFAFQAPEPVGFARVVAISANWIMLDRRSAQRCEGSI